MTRWPRDLLALKALELPYLTALVTAGWGGDARARWTTMTSWKAPSPLDERLQSPLPAG